MKDYERRSLEEAERLLEMVLAERFDKRIQQALARVRNALADGRCGGESDVIESIEDLRQAVRKGVQAGFDDVLGPRDR